VGAAENDMETNQAETADIAFGDLYIDVRLKEKRVLTDGQLMFLPDIEPEHIHHKEWLLRKRSCQRLTAYLTKKKRPLKILEIGCGNGWLSSRLSAIENTTVVGLDITEVEINQAKRVFKKHNLEFVASSFNPAMFLENEFDIILFAASIQYFPSLKNILTQALSRLHSEGEIHVIDTHFYKPGEIQNVMARCKNYYLILGYPEMAAHYFHHPINALHEFNYTVHINPLSIVNRIGKKEPFYWISVKH
jgi:2-polyprenyl-3-methyl-5-hydroxy-6-metoxy-1,4-benzoquinol methylase